MRVAQSCPTLCNPTDYTIHGILLARILEWVAFPVSRGSSQPRDRTQISCIIGGIPYKLFKWYNHLGRVFLSTASLFWCLRIFRCLCLLETALIGFFFPMEFVHFIWVSIYCHRIVIYPLNNFKHFWCFFGYAHFTPELKW